MSEIDDCVDYSENYMEQDDFSDNGSESIDLKQVDKRAHHNALERKRRDHIKDSFSSLRDAIPLLHGEKINSHKASRAQILKKAAEYIDHMRRKNNDHQKDIDVLKRENKLLEEKIRALEELKCAGQLNSNKPQSTRTRSKSLIVNNGSSTNLSTTNITTQQQQQQKQQIQQQTQKQQIQQQTQQQTQQQQTQQQQTQQTSINNESTGVSILQPNRIKTESISSSFDTNTNSDDSENLINSENNATVVQIVKRGNVIHTNGKISLNNLNTSNGTTLLVNGTIIKASSNLQKTNHSLLGGPPNKRKRLVIAANSSIISK